MEQSTLKRTGLKRTGLLLIVAAIWAPLPPVDASRTATEATYQRRFQALAPDDVNEHLKLAIWCRDQQAYDLLLAECNHILGIDPRNRQAQLLAELAKARLPAGDAKTAPPPTAAPSTNTKSPARTIGKIRPLTADEVQMLRRAELRLDRPESVKVDLSDELLARFWAYVSGREGLKQNDRVMFNRLKPAEQAQTILRRVRNYQRSALDEDDFTDEFSGDVIILDDPLVFDAYRRHVWPVIKTGCATSGCHGGKDAPVLRLFNERVMDETRHYANFLMLNDLTANGEKVINRDNPARSLLVTYLIPNPAEAVLKHPGNIKTPFRTPRDRRYQNVVTWIDLLELPQPEYGVSAADLEQ